MLREVSSPRCHASSNLYLCSRPSKMLPDEVMSLEADILRLRKGIARLTSTASVSAPRYYESGAGSGSSNSTYGENSPRYSELSLKTL